MKVISQIQVFYFLSILWIFCRGMYLIKSYNKNKDKINIEDEIMKNLFAIYLAKLFSVIYFPLTIYFTKNSPFVYPTIWLRPIWSLIRVWNSGNLMYFISQIGGNLILLTPLAFTLCYFREKRFFNLKKIIIICFIVSCSIEVSQLIFSLIIPSMGRFFEINDIICNTVSGLWGFLFYRIYKNIKYNLFK